jgi:C4-dicarboxylate-specific signal transduction histidine kinase
MRHLRLEIVGRIAARDFGLSAAINETIGEVIAMARSTVQRNRISLQTQLANDLPLILGDRIQLQQVILNPLINAIEAMSEVSEDPRELWVSRLGVHEPCKPVKRRKTCSRRKPWPKRKEPTY